MGKITFHVNQESKGITRLYTCGVPWLEDSKK